MNSLKNFQQYLFFMNNHQTNLLQKKFSSLITSKTNIIISAIVSVGIVIVFLIIILPTVTEMEYNQWDLKEKEKQLKEISTKGNIILKSTDYGKDIIDYSENEHPADSHLPLPHIEEILNEKQDIIILNLNRLDLDDSIKGRVHVYHVKVNSEWKAIEIGIDPNSLNENNIPKYFETIRKTVGEKTKFNIVLIPTLEPRPLD